MPALRVVLDHLPALDPPTSRAERGAYDAVLRELGQRPQVCAKLSQIIHRVDGQVSTDLDTYRARLDVLMETFGEDRVLFGSDWPTATASRRSTRSSPSRRSTSRGSGGQSGEVLLAELRQGVQVDTSRGVTAS